MFVIALAGVVVLAVAASSAFADIPVCTPTSSPTKCTSPRGLATDFETGLLYVADHGNNRIDIFKNGGTEPGTPASFGGVTEPEWIAVDNVASSPSHHDIYATTADFKVKKFEPSGTKVDEFGEHGDGTPENCQIERADDPIAVGPNGDVYVADSYLKEITGGKAITANRIVKFSATGACIGTVPLFQGELRQGELAVIRDLAVDSTGVIYVTVEGSVSIRQYSATGVFVKEFDEVLSRRLAVDAEDHLFADQGGVKPVEPRGTLFFAEYDSAAAGGAIMHRFGYGPDGVGAPGLAALHTADGDLFASNLESGVRYLQLPPPGPVVFPDVCKVKGGAPGSVRATLQAEVNPEGGASEFKFEYEPVGGGTPFEQADSGAFEPLAADATDFELHEATQTIQPLEAETEYRCRVVTKNANGETTGPEGTFKTNEPFSFGPAWSSGVREASAVVNAEGNPNGAEWTGQIEYVTDAQYQASGFEGALRVPTSPASYGNSEAMTLRSATLTGLAPGTLYHYRLRATQESSFPEGLVCPDEGARHGICPELEHTFQTYQPEEAKPDDRGYELVSPPEKNSAEVVGTPNGRGFFGAKSVLIQAGASSGEAVTYTSWVSFGNAQGAPPTSQYLSERTPSGWTTTNASPFGFQSNIEVPPYLGFTPELGFGAIKAVETPLTPGCPADVEDFYLYEAAGKAFRCLTPEVPTSPPGKFGYGFVYGGASDDGARVFFKTRVRYAGAKAGAGANLYESHEGQVHAVSVLPGQSEPVTSTSRTTFGAKTTEEEQTGQAVLHNAISADGSHAIWTYAPQATARLDSVSPGVETLTIVEATGGSFALSFRSQNTDSIPFNANASAIQSSLESLSTIGTGNVEVSGAGPFTIAFTGTLAGTTDVLDSNGNGLTTKPSELLDRINGSETVQLDAKQGSAPQSGGGTFWAASKDGRVVYFTSPKRLVTGAKTEAGAEDLYRYDFSQPLGSRLVDLTKGLAAGDLQGVIGAGEDGSAVYFVAGSALTEGETNAAGQHAEAGKNNLYVNDMGEGKTRFIAQLSGEDNLDWTAQPVNITARVSLDGRHLAFLSSEASLSIAAGFDNTLPNTNSTGTFAAAQQCRIDEVGVLFGSTACPQAFLYDKQGNTLTCASCNPSRSRPIGPALLPGWASMSEGPRYLTADGSRLFFETYDRLLPEDENGLRDVYEFERSGTGTCSSSSPNFDPLSGGCHFLVSNGRSSDESFLIDASSTGRDVFFSTRSVLNGWDTNENFDVYDYREGGGFPEPEGPVVCEGEAGCTPPSPTAPPPATPATPSFNGPGNSKQKAKKHHKKKAKHKKAKHKKAKHKKAKHKKAKKKGRTGR